MALEDLKAEFGQIDAKKVTKRPLNLFIEGGIGDIAISAPWIEAFKEAIEQDQIINLYSRHPNFVKLCLPWAEVTKTHIQFDKDFPTMDYAIIVTDMIVYKLNEKQLTMPPQMSILFQNYLKSLKPFGYTFAKFPNTIPMFTQAVMDVGLKRHNFIFHQMGLEQRDFEYKCERPKNMPEKVLLINDGFASWHRIAQATKCWPQGNWDLFLRAFKARYPDIAIVQVGEENSNVLRSDINLLGKTRLEEFVAWVLHADYYVGNDSGPTHIRHWHKKPSVVIYGPTPEKYYGYPENINLGGDKCYPCYWQIPEWNETCKLGRQSCLRMQTVTPEIVMKAIEGQMNGNN
jgi:ADP-heptose:LPS heptosyltransferase